MCWHQLEAEVIAGGAQLVPTCRLPFFVAPLRDGDVDHPHAGFALKTKRQPTDDALVIRMWRKNERALRVGAQLRRVTGQ